MQGNLKEQAGIVETAWSVSGYDPTHHPYSIPHSDGGPDREYGDHSRSGRGDPGAMRIINELASWIDQDGQSVWMPEFESLQGVGHAGF